MPRYIDADKLKEQLLTIGVVSDDLYGMGINRGLDRAETAIDMMPTADVVPRWEFDNQKVVKEIFTKIESLINRYYHDGWYTVSDMAHDIAELKKKYTEDK